MQDATGETGKFVLIVGCAASLDSNLYLRQSGDAQNGGYTMAYLAPQYRHDVFVSCAYGPGTGSGGSPLRTWTLQLLDALRQDIRELDPAFAGVSIFFDAQQLDRGQALTSGLREAVDHSALLLIMMTPSYLQSAWCMHELEWFADQVRSRQVGGRVFVVRAISTDEGMWPAFLRDEEGQAIPGFRFHDMPSDPDAPVEPYGWPDLTERNERFRKELSRLRTALMKRLQEMKRQMSGPGIPPAPSG